MSAVLMRRWLWGIKKKKFFNRIYSSISFTSSYWQSMIINNEGHDRQYSMPSNILLLYFNNIVYNFFSVPTQQLTAKKESSNYKTSYKTRTKSLTTGHHNRLKEREKHWNTRSKVNARATDLCCKIKEQFLYWTEKKNFFNLS
jgi:hypothetical protein